MPPPDKAEEYREWQIDAWTLLSAAFQAKERVIYIDECVFTKESIQKLEYANKYRN